MKGSTVTLSQAQAQLSKLVRQVSLKGPVTICRRGQPAAVLMSMEHVESLLETMEILSNPEAMKQIRADKAGRLKYLPVGSLDED